MAALLGTSMVVGMLGGFFANAGLSASELKEECGKAQDLVKQINEVSTFYTKMRDALRKDEHELEQLISDSKKNVQAMNTKILEFKTNNKHKMDREKYFILAFLITVIVIFITKYIITKLY